MNDQVKRVLEQMNQRLGRLEQAASSLYMRHVRVSQRQVELEARTALRQIGREPVMPLEFRSQFGEDVFLWNVLGGQLDGFFIEVGAFDGFNLSVTYGLEAVGWKGLLIEPIPDAFEACQQRRSRSRVVNAALSRPGAPATATFTITSDPMFSRLDNVPAQHVTGPGKTQKTVTVPQTTMNELLAEHNGPIDAAVIDVEGGEMELLAGFDLVKYRPRVMLIEDNSPGNQALIDFMQRNGYTHVGVLEVNRIFIHSDEKRLLERTRII